MQYRAIGLMSGSAGDGIDIAYVICEKGKKWEFDVPYYHCEPYTGAWKKALREASTLDSYAYELLHRKLGTYMGTILARFLDRHRIRKKVDFISSHGHTVFHNPSQKISTQLGYGANLAAVVGIPTITDLRSADLALGGQGAPIVPLGERHLFPDYKLFLNLGGIANISLHLSAKKIIAFDIGPCNAVLNFLANQIGRKMDKDGKIARKGKYHAGIAEKIQALPYFNRKAPKSLDNAWAHKHILPLLSSLSPQDALATYTHSIAELVPKTLNPYETHIKKLPSQLYLSGGGAHNLFLRELLQEKLHPKKIECIYPEASRVDFKEAIIMAFLGILRMENQANTLSGITGGKRDATNGALWV